MGRKHLNYDIAILRNSRHESVNCGWDIDATPFVNAPPACDAVFVTVLTAVFADDPRLKNQVRPSIKRIAGKIVADD